MSTPTRLRLLRAACAILALAGAADLPGIDQLVVTSGQPTVSEAGAGTVHFTVTRLTLTPVGDLAVKFALSGTAAITSDYTVSPTVTAGAGTVTILDGDTGADITFTMVDDALAELSETITVTITPDAAYTILAGGGSDSMVIEDDEPVLQIVADAPAAAEPSTDGSFTVSYAGAARATAVPVSFLATGTAVAGVDYAAIVSVTIAANQNSVTVPVTIIDDTLADDGKVLTISLTSSSAYLIKPGQGIANMTLGNDDTGVTAVSSLTANGSYGLGAPITITVTFSQAVAVSGSPTLALATGGTPALATYAGGSGTTVLSFTYTVGAFDLSADLDCTGTAALALNGGTIVKAATSTAAVLTLPAPGLAGSLGANRNLVVDGTTGGQKPVPGSVQSTDSSSSACGLGQGVAALVLMLAGTLLALRRR
jgi:hypothetical protein